MARPSRCPGGDGLIWPQLLACSGLPGGRGLGEILQELTRRGDCARRHLVEVVSVALAVGAAGPRAEVVMRLPPEVGLGVKPRTVRVIGANAMYVGVVPRRYED